MDRHPREKVIQISGSASLYYVMKSEVRSSVNVRMKRKVLATLLNGMFVHRGDPVMMRNGCLTLCQFAIPQDVVFDYRRVVKILLYIVSEHTADENSFVQRAGIYLLNSLACQIDGQQKLLVGNLGAMERMLTLIKDRVNAGQFFIWRENARIYVYISKIRTGSGISERRRGGGAVATGWGRGAPPPCGAAPARPRPKKTCPG